MNMRDLKIGARLGAGFALILLAASALLVAALVSTSASRQALLVTLGKTDARVELAYSMRTLLRGSALSVRSMGLQSELAGVQKDEAEAKRLRAAYQAERAKVEADGLDDKERALFARLSEIDGQIDKPFVEAVELASQFNTEQAGKLILGKIDPLLVQTNELLTQFIALQKAHARAAVDDSNVANSRVVQALVVAGVLVLCAAAGLAWRLTASITQPLREAAAASARVAAGDLATDIVVTGRDEAADLLAGLREMRGSLARMVGEVRTGTHSLDTASSEIAQGNADLSARTESQASALQQTAASVEQLTDAVKHNAQSAEHALELSRTAAGQAEQGHAVVGRVIETMGAINQHSRKISDITSVINSIAFQTNILALNAAVEAARAGEQGRGFAVVATEVRTLSQRTTAAAKEIEGLIRAAAEQSASGATLVNQAGDTMGAVRDSVRQVATLIGEISAGSRTQTDGISEVNKAIADIDRSTQQNAALVEEAAAAAESMRQQTQRLGAMVGAFSV
jgi:methyl-accepting chemotaxis protein